MRPLIPLPEPVGAARVAVDVVGEKVLPHDPVIDAGAADPALEHCVRYGFDLAFAGGEVHP